MPNGSAQQKYLALMAMIRRRFDIIRALNDSNSNFVAAETAAFHGRKIVEGIAFGCLVALENGIRHVPRDAKGQWKADAIFKSLLAKGLPVFPSPSIIRAATTDEKVAHASNIVIEGQPDRRLTHEQIQGMYERLHRWAHELNPYVEEGHAEFFDKHTEQLRDDLMRLERFIERHTISIRGAMFFSVLRDAADGSVKVIPLTKVADT